MGYLLIDDEKATKSSDSTNASSTTFPETTTTTTTNATKSHTSRLNDISMFVSQPAEMDVLCGQDKNFTKHPGNKIYRSVIASWSERYGQAVNKQSKMRMTTEICKYMKKKYNSRFLKPTPMFMEDVGSKSQGCNLVAFRWHVLTDKAARDKISHALRTSVTASRKRQERREKMKAAQHEKKINHEQQSTHSQQKEGQPHLKLEVEELWMTSPQNLRESMQSFASIPETPPDVWYGDSQSTDIYKYESLPVPSQVSFDSSTDMTSLSSQLFIDENKNKQQSAHSQQNDDQTHLKLEIDEIWMSSPQSLHGSMHSLSAIPEIPSHGWYGDSHSSNTYKDASLPVSNLSSFNSSTDMTSLSSQVLADDSGAWHTDAHLNDLQDAEPLPLSSFVSFTFSTEMAASLSHLLFDDSD